MTNWHKCNKCGEFTDERDMGRYGEYNPDARRTLHYLSCPHCGEREDISEAFECVECQQPADLVEGTDYCWPCYEKVEPDTGDLEAAAKDRRFDDD